MSVPQYTAGEWTAVVRPGFVALVGPGADAGLARALWDAAPLGVVAALDVLARDGLAALPPFAVASVDGTRVYLALRGDVVVEVTETDGTRQVQRAGAVRTWSEQVLESVGVLVARTADAADGPTLPLVDGVAPAGAVRVDVAEVVVPEPVVEPVAEPVAEPVVVPVVELAAEPADEPVVEPVDEAVAEPVDEPVLVPDVEPDDAPSEPSAVVQDDPADDEPARHAAASDGEHETAPVTEVLDVAETPVAQVEPTVVPSIEPDRPEAADDRPLRAPVAPYDVVAAAESFLVQPDRLGKVELLPVVDAGEPDVPPASPDDHDGLTILSSDLAAIRDQLPSWASDEVPGPFHVPAPVEPARLHLSTGLVVTLDRAVLLGRAPQVARVTNRELPRLVTVPSPQQDISRTHAEVRVEGEHVLVTDLDSTNGVHVSRAGEGARRLHPGEPSVVGVDEVVDLGDGVTFTVERGS